MMVQVIDLIALLGKSTEDPEIQKLLTDLKIKKLPRAKYDDPCAYVTLKKQGWGMAFEDEDYLLKNDIEHYGEGKMILTALFFYPEENAGGYAPFRGDFISGVRLSDTRDEILRKLGKPHAKYEKDGVLGNERWNFGEYRLVMTYTPEGKVKSTQVISLKYE
jgi:hypothetical protein